MSQLFKLKEWLSLEEAATHLSAVFSEHVSVADVLRFGIDKHLMLSVHIMSSAYGHFGRRVSIETAAIKTKDVFEERRMAFPEPFPAEKDREGWLEWMACHNFASEGFPVVIYRGSPIEESVVVQFDEAMVSIQGLCDLAMVGGELPQLEYRLLQETTGAAVRWFHREGAIIVYFGRYMRIVERKLESDDVVDVMAEVDSSDPWSHPDNFVASDGLPRDSPIVVRTTAISDFIAFVAGRSDPRPPDARERSTLLRIIRALDVMSKLPLRGASSSVELHLNKLGFTNGPRDATIRKVLEQARALEPDGKPQ